MTGFIDSHCHLQYFSAEEQAFFLDRARNRGVAGFLVPAVRLDDVPGILELAEREDDVWCAAGVHPHEASSWRSGDARRLAEYLGHPKVVAVGECGLDFFYDRAPRDQQLGVMRAQWDVALEHGLPVVVHNRDSDATMLAALADDLFGELTGVMHSFAASPQMARTVVAHGFYVGVSGMVTFPKADNVRAIVGEVPADRLLVETDTPYLTPVPYRGRRNEPAFVYEAGKRLAQELGVSVEELEDGTSRNFYRLFPKAAG